MMAGFYRVDVPRCRKPYCCGFALDEAGVIINAAPIMRRWVGSTVQDYARWARAYGGTFVRIA